jgi:hypothetical protein
VPMTCLSERVKSWRFALIGERAAATLASGELLFEGVSLRPQDEAATAAAGLIIRELTGVSDDDIFDREDIAEEHVGRQGVTSQPEECIARSASGAIPLRGQLRRREGRSVFVV